MRITTSVNRVSRSIFHPYIQRIGYSNNASVSQYFSFYSIPNRLFSTSFGRNDGYNDTLSKADSNDSVPSDDGVIIKTEDGGSIFVPQKSYAGLSDEFRSTLLERAKKGRTVPIVFTNPGAYAQVDRLPEEVISALPPPNRPLWPMKESELTIRYLRAFSFGLAFVALGLYLYLKMKVKGSARLELERRAPWAAKLLVKLGIIGDFDYLNQEDGINRGILFERIWNKYAVRKELEGSVQLSRSALNCIVGSILLGTGGNVESAMVEGEKFILKKYPITVSHFSKEQTVQILETATHQFPNSLLFLASLEIFGIAPSNIVSDIEDLFDRVVAYRKAGSFFTAESLADLCQEVGISCTTSESLDFLKDSSGVIYKSCKDITANTPVDVSKSEFVDFFTAAAAQSEVTESKLLEYLRVFYLLHLSGIREQAGVQQVAS